jgi:aspartyl-tRNA(Asn)/glutamyl-tRNA(Gln) amidotransferase subunit B
VDEARIERAIAHLPETPWALHDRLVAQYGLSHYDAAQLADEPATTAFYEAAAALADPKLAANWIMGDLTALWKERGVDAARSPVSPAALAELVGLVTQGTISGKMAKDVLWAAAAGEGAPREIVARRGLSQISDDAALAPIVDEVLAASAAQVQQYRAGRTGVFGYFVGQVMKRTNGKANPQMVNELLKKRLHAE